jgi:hypothetical protein
VEAARNGRSRVLDPRHVRFGSKADVAPNSVDVGFVPGADIASLVCEHEMLNGLTP